MFSAYVAVSVALLFPLVGLTVNQAASSLTVQLTLDVTLNVVLPNALVTGWSGGVTVNTGGGASCVTVTVLVIPSPVTVIVPVLELVVVFSVYVAVSVSLLLPLAGLTVNQAASSLTVQLTFDVTINVVSPDAYDTGWSGGVTVNTAGPASCVTVTCCVIPPPVTVIVPVLGLIVVFSV